MNMTECAICGSDIPNPRYPLLNNVCWDCGKRATTSDETRFYSLAFADEGPHADPVFIDGIKCWATIEYNPSTQKNNTKWLFRDEYDCASYQEFFQRHHEPATFRGALMGLAAGDALGTTVEFRVPGSFPRLTDIVGGGEFNLKPGQWTDDTSMALCLAESLIEKPSFDPCDQLERYVRWFKEGHLSSTGLCFDIGYTTRQALERFGVTGKPWCGPSEPKTAGNGSLMRLAPVAMRYADQPEEAILRAADSSRTTHGAREAVDACRYFSGLLVGALNANIVGDSLEASKKTLLSPSYCPLGTEYWTQNPLVPTIAEVAKGSFKRREPPEIAATGHVVKTLEAALWAFHKTDNFRDGAILAVNLGDDADTVGAVYGQLAGAFYGEFGIPRRWRQKIYMPDIIGVYAEDLYRLARQLPREEVSTPDELNELFKEELAENREDDQAY